MVTRVRFSAGRIVATPGALEALAEARVSPLTLLARHLSGDFGEVDAEDKRENAIAVEHGYRIISSYSVGKNDAKVWLITEADRSATTVLLPEEY